MLDARLIDVASHREAEQMFRFNPMLMAAVLGMLMPMSGAMLVLLCRSMGMPVAMPMRGVRARRVSPSPDFDGFLPEWLFFCAGWEGETKDQCNCGQPAKHGDYPEYVIL